MLNYLLFTFLFTQVLSQDTRPNFVIILTDDQDVVLGGMEPMKNVQRFIGNEGTTFTNSYVTSPICCPSRASLLSGLHVHNHMTWNNSLLGGCYSRAWRKLEARTFAKALRDTGYSTFYAGKYLNEYGKPEAGGPEQFPPGWTEWHGLVGNSVYYNYTISNNGVPTYSSDLYLTDVIRDLSLNYIENQTESQPFLMVLAPPAPHQPFTPAPRHEGAFVNVTAVRHPNFNLAVTVRNHCYTENQTESQPFLMVLAPPAPHQPFTPAPRHEGAFVNVTAVRHPNFNLAVTVRNHCYTENQTESQPFLMVLAPPAPHQPFTPAPRHEGAFVNVTAVRHPNFNLAVTVRNHCYTENQTESQPFLMVLAPPAPHQPFTPAPRHEGAFVNVTAVRHPNFNLAVTVRNHCYTENQTESQPFLMVLAPPAPHQPFTPAPRHEGAFVNVTAVRHPNFNLAVTVRNHCYTENQTESQPFLMVLAPPAPHQPFTPAPRHEGAFVNVTAVRHPNFNLAVTDKHWLINMPPTPLPDSLLPELDRVYRSRWESLLAVDELVADVVEALDSHSLLTDTYLIYTSDNGYHIGQFSQVYDKRQPYESDIKVPLIIRGPTVPKNATDNQPVMNIDIAPTIMSLAGLPPPQSMDGRSIQFEGTNDLEGTKTHRIERLGDRDMERNMLVEYYGEGKDGTVDENCPWKYDSDNLAECYPQYDCKCQDAKNNTFACLRHIAKRINFKYCSFADSEDFTEIYDLARDPYELTNIVDQVLPSVRHWYKLVLSQMLTCKGYRNCDNPLDNVKVYG